MWDMHVHILITVTDCSTFTLIVFTLARPDKIDGDANDLTDELLS